MPFFFDPLYVIITLPAVFLMMWAQWRLRANYAYGDQMPAPLSGAAAARHILDRGGCPDVDVEEIPGMLTDHYDPRQKVLRLSSAVYHRRSITAVGIAAHEAGHALQDAHHYLPLVIRNFAVPAASFGPGLAFLLFIAGGLFAAGHDYPTAKMLIIGGLIAFGSMLAFQIINLPVEFDASNRAKRVLQELQIINAPEEAAAVRAVLDTAAWTYIAGTLQTLLTLLYYVIRFSGILRHNSDDR